MKDIALCAAAYFVAAWVGLSFATDVSDSITLFWIPSAIAVTTTLLWGHRMLAGVFLGAFAINAVMGDLPLWAAAGIAIGNTGEAWFVRDRFLRLRPQFLERRNEPGDFGRLALATSLGCTIAASVGVLTLTAAGALTADHDIAWASWWGGDAMGILIFTPVLLAFLYPDRGQRER